MVNGNCSTNDFNNDDDNNGNDGDKSNTGDELENVRHA